MDESAGSSGGRAKRQKVDKTGRFAALQRLKSLKGSKNKYEIGNMENVYDEVDEKEYSKRVLQRQDDDWIVDDGGDYVEDGREIFDDDLDEESIMESSKKSKTKTTKKHLSDTKSNGSSKNIMTMMANMQSKKKKVGPTKVDEDDVLLNLMEDLKSEKKEKKESVSSMSSKDYLKSFSSNNKKLSVESIIRPKVNAAKLPQKVFQKQEENSIKYEDSKENIIKREEVISEDFDSDYYNSTCASVDETMDTIEIEEPKEIEIETNGHASVKIEIDDNFEDMSMDDDFQLDGLSESTKVVEEAKPSKISEPEITEECLTEGWETISANVVNQENVSVDTSTLPMVTNKEGEKVFRFYWWDAFEEPFKQPGVVYLFGKVYVESAKAYVSCCVTVKQIPRRIFLLPREKKLDLKTKTPKDEAVTFLDVYNEFNEKVANPNKIMKFKSRKVIRKYAFELHDVPAESEYLEVRYPATDAKISADLSGETFSRVFGTNTSALELLLVEGKIKGPCWLEIKNPQPVQVVYSWCKVDVICPEMKDLVISKHDAPPPPLTIMAINMRTVVNPKNMQNEVVMISCLVHNDYKIDKPAPNPAFTSHFCAFTRISDVAWPFDLKRHLGTYKSTQIFQHDAERSLLGFFLTKLFKIDPDLIVGHDLYGYTIDTLIHRIEHLKIPNWSRIGRLKRSVIPQAKGRQMDKNLTCGRLVCDTHISSRELIRARSYDLDTLCKMILHVGENGRQDYAPEEIKEMYSKSQTLIKLINATMQDTNYILKLMYELNVLPLALQITTIAGNVMSKTLLGGRSERNEYLLLHAFTEKEFIVPDKSYSKKKPIHDEDGEIIGKNTKKKPQYAGGLVLEPKKGFYDKFILLMDFNSLYPSIIQEYNICFTTVTRSDNEDEEPELPSSNSPPGILPIEIRKLVESRRTVKALMKNPDLSTDLKMQYNIRQMALKLTANSMYGCLGFSHSRFYAKPLAALITSRGREILMNTRDVVQKMNFEVIYGDTDSIMINTNCVDYDQVFKIGGKIKQEINKLYKHVELEVDGVFKYMLLLKKKKYAAIVLSKKPNGELIATQEYKGLDIVRRDWSQLSAEIGRHVLDQILSDLTPDERIANIREHLEKVANDLRNKIVPIPLLAITKQLTKNPEDYADKKSLPHLQVAMRINSRGGKKLKAGDTVSYVICDDGSNLPAVQRAYHVDELKNNENLLIDVNYYLSQQIHPVVSRLCEPIDGADAAFIAECLGLDPTSYKRAAQRNHEEEDGEEGDYTLINDLNSFKNCDKFSFTCMNENCKTKIFMDGPLHDNYLALSKCRNPACKTAPFEYLPSIQNALQLAMRSYIDKLYQNWVICEDPACPNRTRRIPMEFVSSLPLCTMCKKGYMYREYRNADLYYQLKYFEYMFNTKRVKVSMSPILENAYRLLHNQVLEVLNFSGYRILDFSKIFKFALAENKGKVKPTDAQREMINLHKLMMQVE